MITQTEAIQGAIKEIEESRSVLVKEAAQLVQGLKHISPSRDDVARFMPKGTPAKLFRMIEQEEVRVRLAGAKIADEYRRIGKALTAPRSLPAQPAPDDDRRAAALEQFPANGCSLETLGRWEYDYRETIRTLLQSADAGWSQLPSDPTREIWAAMGNAIVKEMPNLNIHHDIVASVVYRALQKHFTAPKQGGG